MTAGPDKALNTWRSLVGEPSSATRACQRSDGTSDLSGTSQPRAKLGSLPKGSYRLPTGGFVMKPTGGVSVNGRHIYVQSVRRAEPDVQSLARAFLRLAEAEQQADERDSSQIAA